MLDPSMTTYQKSPGFDRKLAPLSQECCPLLPAARVADSQALLVAQGHAQALPLIPCQTQARRQWASTEKAHRTENEPSEDRGMSISGPELRDRTDDAVGIRMEDTIVPV